MSGPSLLVYAKVINCQESSACLSVTLPGAWYLEGLYCPAGQDVLRGTIYQKSGPTPQENLYLSRNLNTYDGPVVASQAEGCGSSGTNPFVVRQVQPEIDVVDTAKGFFELKGDVLRCLSENFVDVAFGSATAAAAAPISDGSVLNEDKPCLILPGGKGFIKLGPWRIGAVDGTHFSFSHESGNTAVTFRKDGTSLPGPRTDYGLSSRPLLGHSDVVVGDGFLEFEGKWRLGDVDGTHFSLSHLAGQTEMIWRNDGTMLAGPRTDFETWSRHLQCGNVASGSGFVQLGNWRVGNVDDTHMSSGLFRPTRRQ